MEPKRTLRKTYFRSPSALGIKRLKCPKKSETSDPGLADLLVDDFDFFDHGPVSNFRRIRSKLDCH